MREEKERRQYEEGMRKYHRNQFGRLSLTELALEVERRNTIFAYIDDLIFGEPLWYQVAKETLAERRESAVI